MSSPESSEPVIERKGYFKLHEKGQLSFVLTLYGKKIQGGHKNVRTMHFIWRGGLGIPFSFYWLHITIHNMRILSDSTLLRQLADIPTDDIDLFETRLKELGFVHERD